MACHGLNVMAPKSFEVWGCEAIKRVEPRDIGVCLYVGMYVCIYICIHVKCAYDNDMVCLLWLYVM